MQILRSRVLGYCNGVSRVIELAQECVDRAHKEGLNAYSIGWFIHNPHVVARFASQGMKHIDSPYGVEPGIALVRAHGITDVLRNEFLKANFTLIDGTCGTVAHSQQLVRDVADNQQVVIIGLKTHSEVVALSGVIGKNNQVVPVTVIECEEDLKQIDSQSTKELLCVVQTTFESDKYDYFLKLLKESFGHRVIVANRLCPSTKRRHDALLEMMLIVDAILVIGGRMSANTTALAQLVKDGNIPVWHIEDKSEIPEEIFSFKKVGVTAGTSTPEEDIRAIIEVLEGEVSVNMSTRYCSSEEQLEIIRNKKAFICDMDGVLYHGNRILPGAIDFITWLQKEEKNYLFLTNSSEKSAFELHLKMRRLGIEINPSHFYTSALATASFLASQIPQGTAYVIGEAGLINALYEVGYSMNDVNPDYVVVGESHRYNFESVTKAVSLILKGARLVGTNPDTSGPSEEGLVPATGSLILPIAKTTGVEPYFVGKPNPVMMRQALHRLETKREDTAIIGDRMDTDILSGIESGIETILVLSGVSDTDTPSRFAYRPSLILDSVGTISHYDK